jgi:hypothetical protein
MRIARNDTRRNELAPESIRLLEAMIASVTGLEIVRMKQSSPTGHGLFQERIDGTDSCLCLSSGWRSPTAVAEQRVDVSSE